MTVGGAAPLSTPQANASATAPGGVTAFAPRFASPSLGVVRDDRFQALENGGRIALGDGKAMEVFLAPYPPAMETDLHLFLMEEDTFEPVANASMYMLYEMYYMDHGEGGTPPGRQVRDGQFVFPLYFIMYGEYKAAVTVSWPGERGLEQERVDLLVTFAPQGVGE